MNGVIALSNQDLLVATTLVLVAGVISLVLQLRLERQLALATVRTVVQLFLVGYVLRYVFQLENVWAVSAVVFVMLVAASRASVARCSRTYSGALSSAFLTLVLAGLLTAFSVTRLVVEVQPWWKPQYLIPLLGMVLGNSLTGVSLCLESLLEALDKNRAQVEMELAHGATSWEAAREPLQQAVRRGMIPIINSMMVVGLVSLPGMMTGQILAGTDPLEAVKYQIVVMFMLAFADGVTALLLLRILRKMAFTEAWQPRL